MIDMDNILGQIGCAALWCGGDAESVDLARAVSVAIENKISVISVANDAVSVVWPWLENKKIKIYSRFYVNRVTSDDVSALSEKINKCFKQGADGVQIFVSVQDLDNLVGQLCAIRDDLFFNKDLFIGLNINDIGPFDWELLYQSLIKIRATGLVIVLGHDSGDASDFVGRVYAALSEWDEKNNFCLHFILGNNFTRIEQADRLVRAMCPDLSEKVCFFING